MKIWPPFVLISLRKEHFYGNAAAELRALFKRVKWCMLWPKMHSLSLHLKIVSLYLFFERLFSSFNKFWNSTAAITFRNGLKFLRSGQIRAVLFHFRGIPSMNWFIGGVLPCANFFIFYIYYLHMWSSCVMAFLVKRKISETCTAKIIFEEILHGQTY